jgi:hypothetical protein
VRKSILVPARIEAEAGLLANINWTRLTGVEGPS